MPVLPPAVLDFPVSQLTPQGLSQASTLVEQALEQPHHSPEVRESLQRLLNDIKQAQSR
ncbi:hypothetical protein [Ectothiorhodospira shaposhnikovii]|uniref:hypothetical protein n=1 Tax=Ectothiorhodospira shaposhnikovii TaxID=1054 RepID=UPI001EE864A8|nr:hypothetical protein [Ectothiorhodospira shaposhnikovii]MCG5514350.1 hypothetical protein [Ectothiorhodospira shaposhnikovii]